MLATSRGGRVPVQRQPPAPPTMDSQWARVSVGRGKRPNGERAQSALTSILKSVMGGLTSIILTVLGALTTQFTLESPLDWKEIQPVHPKGDQSWVFIGRTDAEAETPILWPPHAKS